jgi:uncharacterized membrane protein
MREIRVGQIMFALGFAGLGVLSIFSADFPYTWEPVPAWVPGRAVLAVLSGVLLLAGAIGLMVRRIAAPTALALTAFLLGWVLVLQAPRAAQAPGNIGMWLGVAESIVLLIGGWALFASLSEMARSVHTGWMGWMVSERGLAIARMLFGLACLVLGTSHFVYTEATAGMIPAWIPSHTFFAYFTGVAHIATGMAVLCGVVPRLAVTMESLMISLFVLLLHLPAAIAQPDSRLNWTMVFIATALAGGVWNLAGTLRGMAWVWRRWTSNREQPQLELVQPSRRF